MQSRYSETFFKEMTNYLYKHKMAFSDCDVVEHTLLRLAGISSMPVKSVIDTNKGNKERVTIKLTDLNSDDALLFTSFLQKHDASAVQFIKSPEDRVICFDIDGQIMLQNLLPLIQGEIERSEKINPEILEPYIEASKRNWNLNDAFGLSSTRITGAPLTLYKLFYPESFEPINEEDEAALKSFIEEHMTIIEPPKETESANIVKDTNRSSSPLIQQNLFTSSRDARTLHTQDESQQDQDADVEKKPSSYTPK